MLPITFICSLVQNSLLFDCNAIMYKAKTYVSVVVGMRIIN